MTRKNPDLHGFVPDKSPVALLLIDVINDLDFPGSEQLIENAVPMAQRLAALKARAREHDIPVVYVNDNFGRWQSDWRRVVDHCLHDDVPGRPLAELLPFEDDDYFVLKPKHSGFFSTTLDTLLDYLGTQTLILAGLAGNICVLFTANDAYMRDYKIVVPRDCIASNTVEDNDGAIALMEQVLQADATPSEELDLEALIAGHSERDSESNHQETSEATHRQ